MTNTERIAELESQVKHLIDALKTHWEEIQQLKSVTMSIDMDLGKHLKEPDAHNPGTLWKKNK